MILLALLLAVGENVREAPPQKPQAAPQLTRAPEVIEFHEALYPPERLARGETADVPCTVDIDEHGNASKVEPDPAAPPDFAGAAAAAIRQFRFSPAEVDGRPAPVRIRYVYRFVIRKQIVHVAIDTGSIHGEILEAGTRRPIAGADVSVQGEGVSGVTGKDGRFALGGIPVGAHRLEIGAGGFAQQEPRVTIEKDKDADAGTVYLRRTVAGELSAVISAEKPQEAPTRRTLTHDELVNVPGTLNDPVRVIQNLPGLARAPFLSGALLVRGSPPADTGIYFDGHRVPVLFHFLGGPSIINEQLLDRIDFYPGGYGAYYGRNLTGAIDIGTRKGDPQGLHGSASLDLIEAVGFVEGPVAKDTEVALAARRSHVDLFLPLFLPNNVDNGSTVVTPIYWDYQARADHKLANGDALSLLLFGSDDKLTVIQTGGRKSLPLSLDTHIGFHRAIATLRHAISESLQLVVSPAVGWAVTSFSAAGVGATGSAQGGVFHDYSADLRAELQWTPRAFLTVRAGTDSTVDHALFEASFQTAGNVASVGRGAPEEFTLQRALTLPEFSEYLEADLKLGKLQLVPGFRSDQIHTRDNQRIGLDPRIWARYSLSEQTSLKAYAGLYHQPANPFQYDPLLGNPRLDLESSGQLGFGVDHHFSELVSLTAEVFYNRRWNLVVPVDPLVTNGVVDNSRFSNTGIGRSYGLELLLRREFTATVYGWIAYTLSRSQILSTPGDPWRAFTYDQPHNLIVVAGFKPAVGWDLSSRLRFVSGNPTAPIDSATFNADTGRYLPDRGVFGDARLPAFFQLDVRAQKTWTWDVWQLSLYLDVENVTNYKNEEIHVFDYRYRAQGSISGIPILPTFGVKARF